MALSLKHFHAHKSHQNSSSYGKFLGRTCFSIWKLFSSLQCGALFSYIVMILPQVHLRAFADRMSKFNYKVTLGKKFFKKF